MTVVSLFTNLFERLGGQAVKQDETEMLSPHDQGGFIQVEEL